MSMKNSFNRNPVFEALKMVELALSMQFSLEKARERINYHDLRMRIGIHTVNIFSI